MDANRRFFQWLVSERRGEVCEMNTIVEEDGEIYVTFKDNSRCNQDLILNLNERDVTDKMMAEVENMSKLWTFKEEIVGEDTNRVEEDWESAVKYDVPTVTEIMSDGKKVPVKKKKVELIPPARTRPEVVQSKFGTIINSPPPPPVEPIPEVDLSKIVNTDDPVWIMMNKSKKTDTEVNMTLTISLPSQSLFDVIKESFDDGNEKGLEYIIENIDITDIKKSLKEGLNQMYNPKTEEESSIILDGKVKEFVTGSSGTMIFEPETVIEPEVRDATPEEIKEIISKNEELLK